MNKSILATFVCLSAISFAACEMIAPSGKSNSNTAVVQDGNKSLMDSAADAVFGTEKTGIPECDRVLAELEKQTQSANETMLENGKRIAVKQTILVYLRDKTGVANMSAQDKTAYGKHCQQLAANFITSPSPAKK